MEVLEGTSKFSDAVLEKYIDPDSDQYHAMLEEIRKELNFTTLHYHRLDDMMDAIELPSCNLCTYCWSGRE
jgi:amidophosphoribosyltransferase